MLRIASWPSLQAKRKKKKHFCLLIPSTLFGPMNTGELHGSDRPSVVMSVAGTAVHGGRRVEPPDFSALRLNSSLKLPWSFKIVIATPARGKAFARGRRMR